jgi:hypothetical protein
MAQRSTITIIAGRKASGEPVFEEVLVDRLGGDEYQVIATPGLVLGIARADRIRWTGGEQQPTVLERGGYVALQIHGEHRAAYEIQPQVAALGGYLDGRAPLLTVYSIPVRAGFGRIEQLAEQIRAGHPEVEWYYGNVYAEDGTTPLNWW